MPATARRVPREAAVNGTGFRPGTLLETIMLRSEHAQRVWALRTLPTQTEVLDQDGVRFVLRVGPGLAAKPKQPAGSAESAPGSSPFLPPDPDLFVADLSPSHACVLNKFNVLPNHVLIVTRRFEDQETLLGRADFEALWTAMSEFPALGFYNGGRIAGASQDHKHLQMVPLPMADTGPGVPIEALLPGETRPGEVCHVRSLPFRHAFVRLDRELVGHSLEAAAAAHAHYRALLTAGGIKAVASEDRARQSRPYNLLVTREWMLLVPRAREHFRTVSVNALGFAGSFFVRTREELEMVKSVGPMAVLHSVAAAT